MRNTRAVDTTAGAVSRGAADPAGSLPRGRLGLQAMFDPPFSLLGAAVRPVLGAESGNGLLELFAEIVETIRFCGIDGGTDRRDQIAVGCQQGRGHDERVRERDSAVEGESAGADLGELGEELPDVARPARDRRGRGGGTSRRRGRWRAGSCRRRSCRGGGGRGCARRTSGWVTLRPTWSMKTMASPTRTPTRTVHPRALPSSATNW